MWVFKLSYPHKKMIKTIKLENGDVIIINWDTLGHMAGWIDTLFQTSKNLPDCGILTALVLDHSDKIFCHGGFISPRVHVPVSYAMGETYYGQYDRTREVEVSRMICSIIKKPLIDKLPIPENLGENAFVDADYCLEAKKLGFKTYATAELIVQYKGDIENYDSLEAYGVDFEKNYNAFNAKWGKQLDEGFGTPVLYQTSVFQPSGFAMAARGYIKGLTDNKVTVAYNYLKGTNEEEPDSDDEIINSICENHGDLSMPQVIWAQAPYFNKNSGKYKIGHCEFEGDPVPESWIPECNSMNEIWVPSNWDREKFRRAGVTVPIYVIWQGIDKDYFHPDIAPMNFEIPQTFKFIANGAWDPRKNFPNLIKAFQMEFTKNEDVALVIKTMNNGLVDDIGKEVEAIKKDENGGHVYIKEAGLKKEEIGSLYTAGDCFVLPTHGEAWGLPLFEALACGIPVITTDYGSPAEILRDDKGEPLPGVHFVKMQKALAQTPYMYLEGCYWAEPSIPDLMKKMRYVFEHSAEEKAKALETSKLIRQKFDWVEVCKPIKERLQAIYQTK